MSKIAVAKFRIGQVIRHRRYPVRGVVFDVDPEFDESCRSHELILVDGRECRNQPFYHLFAENNRTPFVAYFSEQDLLADASDEPVQHPQIKDMFEWDDNGCYRRRSMVN
ncbi:heat shock protein HspQ [Bradyrhizobium sp.]|uniref:heat shock protein HspQ n=1 Tax=Bradyrhizobium sp. TaxID=376 RepID=UPI0040378170